MKRVYFVVLCFLTISFSATAQVGKLRGFVLEKANDVEIPFANVALEGTSYGTVTSENGYYVINDIPAGNYTMKVTYVGYETFTKEVTIVAGKITTEKIYLAEGTKILDDVDITAERHTRETKVRASVITLNPKEIRQFSVGGDPDIIKAIYVLPGVVTTGDQGGQIYIRGGAPIQNLVLLDGMIVYNPFHSIGFFSVFDVDIIRTADVYTGGFKAEYGSRNSAVIDIRTRDGNRGRFAGKLQASTYSSKLLLETPIGAKNDNGLSSSSFLISGKTSYLNETSSIFYPYVETEYGGLPFEFTDLYAKLATQSNNGSKAALFGFSFDDAVRFNGNNSVDWNSIGGGFNFTAVPPASAVLISGDFSYSKYDITAIEGDALPKTSSISGFNGGLDFNYFVRENDELKFGLEAIGYRTVFSFFNSLDREISQEENTTELGAYAQYKYTSNRLLLEPGVRVHYYGSQSELSFEPRLGLKYNINDFLRLKASGGFYSQNLVAGNSDRDVVNLFYGFLSGPADIPDEFRGEEVDSRLQLARHAVLGLEVEVTDKLTVNVEAYVKDFNQLTNLNRNKIYEDNLENSDIPDVLKSDYIIEKGLARGLDFLAKYQSRDWYIWLAYSISRVTRDDGIIEYAPHFDRRHNLNFVGTHTFGKNNSWEASLRYNFGTGFPFTPTQLFYSKKPFVNNDGRIDVAYDYTTENGEQDVLYGDLNSSRLPNYHRVDISITKRYELSKTSLLEISAGATNILNYENVFYYDRIDNERVNQLPIMPTVSLSYSF